MKLIPTISSRHRHAGSLLVECVVYIAVFTILTAIATATFYFCWDHSKALIYATDDIASALRAGEQWRADVRAATGKFTIETTVAGEVVRIPESQRVIVYRFESGEIHREISTLNNSQLLLPKVKTSHMAFELRGPVKAWCWELELAERRQETHLPLRFTFEAVPTKP